jgi:signal peptidase I
MELAGTELERSKPNATAVGKPGRERGRAGRGYIIIKQTLACAVMAGMAYGCFQLSQRYVLQSIQVAGRSMAPTLADSSRYLLNRLVYHFREPKPSDIVVLQDPEDKGYAVKRIVAKPGDSVYVNGGQIFVNGKPLKEPYLAPQTKTFAGPKYSAQFWVCGQHQYFVLGDNRNNSTDSRVYGAVPQENILGTVFP